MPLHRIIAIALVSAIPLAVSGAGAAQARSASVHPVLQLDLERYRAMVARDWAALDRILADDLTYTHSVGRVENKQQYIAALKDGRLTYLSITPREIVRHDLGGGAQLLTGKVAMSFRTNGTVQSPTMQMTAVYARRKGRLQLVALHNSRIVEQP